MRRQLAPSYPAMIDAAAVIAGFDDGGSPELASLAVPVDAAGLRPWFVFYNRYWTPRAVRLPAHPFPFDEFPPISPWEDCIILAHHGVEPIARRAGYATAEDYLLAMIRLAGMGAV